MRTPSTRRLDAPLALACIVIVVSACSATPSSIAGPDAQPDAVQDASPDSRPDSGPDVEIDDDAEIVLKIDFSARRQRVGRLIGWNIGSSSLYAAADDARHPEWRTDALVDAVGRLRDVRAANGDRPTVRFSGLQIDGQLGNDGYHFWDFADPQAPPAPDDNMSPAEYMAIVDEVQADPVIMLNFGSGTAAEAADYVQYLAGTDSGAPMVAARQAAGRAEPWPTDIFEVGNEIYENWNTGYSATGNYSYANPKAVNGGDPDWYGRPASDVANYAARALEYIAAVLAVHPKARFYIPLTQATWDAWGGPEVALPHLKGVLEHPAVAGVVVHQYTLDDGVLGHGATYEQDAWVLASADFFRPLYQALRASLATFDRAEPLELTVTEYHAVANIDFLRLVGPTPAAALGIADALMLYAELGVELAMQHMSLHLELDADKLSSSWHVPFALDGGVLVNRPTYTITRLFADHLDRDLVETVAVRMPTAAYTTAEGPFSYAIVHAAAFVSEDGDSGSVMLLNRDLERPRTVSLVFPAGWSAISAQRLAPPDLWSDVDATPLPVEAAPFDARSDGISLTLPPHSFTAIQVER